MIQLPNPQGTIDLTAKNNTFALDNPLPSAITNFLEQVTLVNQNGDTLVNQNGDTLIAMVTRTSRTGVITLGA